MTHGQTFLDHPHFLEALMVDGGLRQIAVHIDITQAGRAIHSVMWEPKPTSTHSERPLLNSPEPCGKKPAFNQNSLTTVPSHGAISTTWPKLFAGF
jgi:hypothetical protein